VGEVKFEEVAAEGAQEGRCDAGRIVREQTNFGKREPLELGQHCSGLVKLLPLLLLLLLLLLLRGGESKRHGHQCLLNVVFLRAADCAGESQGLQVGPMPKQAGEALPLSRLLLLLLPDCVVAAAAPDDRGADIVTIDESMITLDRRQR